MDIEAARLNVIARYPKSKGWRDKVMSMKEDQILAIYRRMQNEEPKPKPEPVIEEPPEDLTLF